ncbi:MAG: magnesium chelatase domain-containing protein [Terracidiphilus sp.]
MLFKALSAAVYGIDASLIDVEVDYSGVVAEKDVFHTVGLPDAAVRESRDRVRAAIKNSGYTIPPTFITINLAPADLKKEGSGFDLPIAVGILGAYGALRIDDLSRFLLVGELGLDGSVRPIPGMLPIAIMAREKNIPNLILPAANAMEAAVVEGVNVYLNDKEAKTIVIDPGSYLLIKRMWQFMVTGAYSPRRIWEIATEDWGLRTVKRRRIGGKPPSLSAVYRIFTNPFYAGVLEREGKTYPGKHQALVTIEEFDHVQRLLGRPGQPRKTRTFAYTGMIRCGECGFMVTGEEKVNRFGTHYTYYHCSKRRLDRHCAQPYLSLENIESQITAFLSEISLPDRFHKWAAQHLERTMKEKQHDHATQKESLLRAQAASARELDNLTKLRIRDLLSDEEYVKERRELERKGLGLTQKLDMTNRQAERFEPSASVVSFNHSLISRFQSGNLQRRRMILTTVGSNLVLKDKKLSIDVRKPFRRWTDSGNISDLRAFVRDVRTHCDEDSIECQEMLGNIREIMDDSPQERPPMRS